MSNRLLSFFLLTLLVGGIFGGYYYFFVASTANISLIVNGSGSASVVLTSEFGNSYVRKCDRNCLFEGIPAVNYTISVKREGYTPFAKTTELNRGETKKIMIAMEREIILTEQKKKKEETITAIKLKKDIQEVMETNTGSITLGYRSGGIYYALPNDTGWSIFLKKDGAEIRNLFKIPDGVLETDSLDIYEGHMALNKGEHTTFYSLANGEEAVFVFTGKILGIKDTSDRNTKIIKSLEGVFMYTVSEKLSRFNLLYDDVIQLPSGEIVALVKKSSKEKHSLLSLADTENDYVFLIGQDTRERKTLLKTPKDGRLLRYKNDEILFIDEEGEVFVIKNIK